MIDLGKCWKYKIKFSLWKTFRNISEKELSLWPPLGKNTCFSRKVNIYILYCFRISEFQYLKKIKELIIGEWKRDFSKCFVCRQVENRQNVYCLQNNKILKRWKLKDSQYFCSREAITWHLQLKSNDTTPSGLAVKLSSLIGQNLVTIFVWTPPVLTNKQK